MAKFLISIMFALFHSMISAQHTCQQFTNAQPYHYQDIVVDGKTICAYGFGQKSEQRCKEIEKIIAQYKRPVTVLDFGAAEGYFSFMLAPKFPNSVFVMIESNNRYILPLCKTNNLKNVILLNHFMQLEDLQHLAQCEHFDIVITMNVLHHFYDEWKEALDAVCALGEKIIIETPPSWEETSEHWQDLNTELTKRATKTLCQTPRWNKKDRMAITYLIERKKMHFKKKSRPGIKLITFEKLQGIYPEKDNKIIS